MPRTRRHTIAASKGTVFDMTQPTAITCSLECLRVETPPLVVSPREYRCRTGCALVLWHRRLRLWLRCQHKDWVSDPGEGIRSHTTKEEIGRASCRERVERGGADGVV